MFYREKGFLFGRNEKFGLMSFGDSTPEAKTSKLNDKDVECTSDRQPNEKMSFRWSLQPMLTWMRCIGVFLDSPGIISSNRTRAFVIVFGFFLFCVHSYRNGIITVALIQSLINSNYYSTTDKQQKPEVGAIWNEFITSFNHTMVTVVSQILLISAAATKWSSLVKILYKMERSNFFEPKDYERFRQIFTSGLMWLLTVGCYLDVVFNSSNNLLM